MELLKKQKEYCRMFPDKKRILSIDELPDLSLNLAVNLFRSGGIFIYPTDTIYGFGGNPFNENVIRRIGEIKGRDENKQFIWLLSDLENVLNYVELSSNYHYDFLNKIWPGPVSAVFNLNERTRLLTNSETIAIRVPDNEFCHSLLTELSQPLISTSVNFSNEKPLIEIKEIIKNFSNLVDAIFHTSESNINVQSTIMNLTSEEPKLIREGSIKFIELLKNLS